MSTVPGILVSLIAALASGQVIQNEGAKLTSGAAAGSSFARSVAIDGETALIGASTEHTGAMYAGAAYVFVRSGTIWSKQAKLTASDEDFDDRFGYSVAIDGDTAVMGAWYDDVAGVDSGSAYVFVRNGSNWSEQAKLTASDGAAIDRFGVSVDVDGDSVVVGSFLDSDAGQASGSAYVFVRNGTSWSEQVKLTAIDAAADDKFGIDVSISGDTVVVGAPRDDDAGQSSGSAYVFVRSGVIWSEQAKLTASDASMVDSFGGSVSVDGDTVVIGAANGDDGVRVSGSAYVFVRNGSAWSEQAELTASDAESLDRFGTVSLSDNTVVVGAHYKPYSLFLGAAYVFVRDGANWSELLKLTTSDAAINDQFATAVGLSGSTVVGGAPNDEVGLGAAYVFSVEPPECFLVVGGGPGKSPFVGASHPFDTQVGPTVEAAYSVLLNDIPEFVLPTAASADIAPRGALGTTPTAQPPPPPWLLDGMIAVQVLMWNPEVFPGQPEQYSAGLDVQILPTGQVVSTPYGSAQGGLDVWAEVDTNAQGQKVLRFPFSIEGM